jgi:hypothetical protein
MNKDLKARLTPKHLVPVNDPRPKRMKYIRQVGELIAINVKDVGWMFGRVAVNDLAEPLQSSDQEPPWPRHPGSQLMYFYSHVSKNLDVIPRLNAASQILFVMAATINIWKSGYAKTVRDPCSGIFERIPHNLLMRSVRTHIPDYVCDERGMPIVADRFLCSLGCGGVIVLDNSIDEIIDEYRTSGCLGAYGCVTYCIHSGDSNRQSLSQHTQAVHKGIEHGAKLLRAK